MYMLMRCPVISDVETAVLAAHLDAQLRSAWQLDIPEQALIPLQEAYKLSQGIIKDQQHPACQTTAAGLCDMAPNGMTLDSFCGPSMAMRGCCTTLRRGCCTACS